MILRDLSQLCAISSAAMCLAVPCFAQAPPAAAQAPPAADASLAARLRERPRYTSDPQRLERTISIEAAFNEKEWAPFYTIDDGAIKGTIYCNWDRNFLYVAARTDQPAGLLLDVDMNGDGWLRGADNLELTVGSTTTGGPASHKVRVLDAESDKDNPTWHDKRVDGKGFQISEKTANAFHVITIAIPRNTLGLNLKPRSSIGLRAEFLPAGSAETYTPTAPYEPHLMIPATLVDAHVQTMPGITPRIFLSEKTCVPGQKLFATLELSNRTNTALSVKNVVWTVTGVSTKSLDPVRGEEIDPIQPNRRIKTTCRTLLPEDMPAGSYTLAATAELDGGKQIRSATVFNVIEPIKMQITSAPRPVILSGQTRVTVTVEVVSYALDPVNATIDLARYPDIWVLDGSRRHSVHVEERKTGSSRYTLRLPAGAASGDFPIEATVSWRGRTWHATHSVHVQRSYTAPAPQ